MIEFNPEERPLMTKWHQDINIIMTGNKDHKKGETVRFFNTTKDIAPNHNGYMKTSEVRPYLKIHDVEEFKNANIKADECIHEVELFFWNKHIKDKELVQLSKGLRAIKSIHTLRADFGNYPEITNYGMSYFFETLKTFNLKKLSMSVGTSELYSSRHVDDVMMIHLIKLLVKMKTITHLGLNVQKYVLFYKKKAERV